MFFVMEIQSEVKGSLSDLLQICGNARGGRIFGHRDSRTRRGTRGSDILRYHSGSRLASSARGPCRTISRRGSAPEFGEG